MWASLFNPLEMKKQLQTLYFKKMTIQYLKIKIEGKKQRETKGSLFKATFEDQKILKEKKSPSKL